LVRMNTMSDLIQQARAVLEQAEEQLRSLASAAVAGGRYEEVMTLAELASELVRIRGKGGASNDSGPTSSVGSQGSNADQLTREQTSYPHFCRKGGALVKVGWSKKKNEVYEHRAPREVILALLAALSRGGARKRPVAIEALSPLHTSQNEEIPSYQVYLVLSLLRERGLVEQHGRSGYTARLGDGDPMTLAAELWNALPEPEDPRDGKA